MIVAALLIYAVLTMWIQDRWAWSLFQIGMFALAGWRVLAARRWQLPLAAAPLAAAAAWPLLQLTLGTTVSRSATLDAALNWFTFLVVFAVGCETLTTTAALEKFLDAITIFGAVLAVFAVLQQYSSHGKVFWLWDSGYTNEVLGPFVNRNQYAAWIELLLPIALCRSDRRLGLAAAAVMFGSVVASASRAGFALVAIEVAIVLAVTATRRTALGFGALAVATTAIIGWHSLWERFAGPFAEPLRIEATRASWDMVRDHPWVGYGLGTWSTVYPRYASFDPGVFLNQAHNDWLQWASEGGVPFVLLFAMFTALLWKRAVPSIYGLGTVAFLLHALVDYPMQQRPALAAWFFAVAAAVAQTRHGLLRRTRHRPDGHTGRDSSRLQTAGASTASGSLRRGAARGG